MSAELSGVGAAAYYKSRMCDGGHKRTQNALPAVKKLSAMNMSEMKTVKKQEEKQVSERTKEISKDPKEKKIYSGAKSSKKLGGHEL